MKKGEKKSWLESRIKEILHSFSTMFFRSRINFKIIDIEEYLIFKKGKLVKRLEQAFLKEGLAPLRGVMPSWTEASEFHKANIACVVFGPGNLEQSHTDKEHIKIKDVKIFSKVLFNLFMYYL